MNTLSKNYITELKSHNNMEQVYAGMISSLLDKIGEKVEIDFHTLCDNDANSMVIIETDYTKGIVTLTKKVM